MHYKVIPFRATVQQSDNFTTVANQLEEAIKRMEADGWQYMQMESVETVVAGSKGCFGLNQQPAVTTSIKVLVFCRN